MKQETINQSRQQLEEVFASLGSDNKSSRHTLYVILTIIAIFIIGAVIGVVVGYDIADSNGTNNDEQNAPAINLMKQVEAIDSSAVVSLQIGDTTQTYMVIKQDSVK